MQQLFYNMQKTIKHLVFLENVGDFQLFGVDINPNITLIYFNGVNIGAVDTETKRFTLVELESYYYSFLSELNDLIQKIITSSQGKKISSSLYN